MPSENTQENLLHATERLDQLAHMSLARAWTDWALNLAVSPGTQARLATKAQVLGVAWLAESLRTAMPPLPTRATAGDGTELSTVEEVTPSLINDARFGHPAWSQWPWSV